MWNKLVGSIDFGKLTINSISGFIMGTALLLLVDAFTPGHLAQEFLSSNSLAGTKVVEALMVVVGSAAMGLLADNLYQTFGRWYAGKFWKLLPVQLDYRNCLMENLGLSKQEFEWVQNNSPTPAADVESRYLRYTEVTGSSAYALMFLGIALAPFLCAEYHFLIWVSLLVTLLIGFTAVVLLVTSAAYLTKYEMNKTASAMAVIRKMSTHNLTYQETFTGKGFWQRFTVYSWWMPGFVGIMLILSGVTLIPVSIQNKSFVIGAANSDGTVPTLEISVTADNTMPPDPVYRSMAVQLEKSVNALHLVAPPGSNAAVNSITPLSSIPLTGPKMTSTSTPWNLDVNIGDVIQANNTVMLNARFSSGECVYASTWQYPVLVTDEKGKTTYLLAYVKVTITPATAQTTTISSSGTTTNQTGTSNSTAGAMTTTNAVTTNIITTNAVTTTIK